MSFIKRFLYISLVFQTVFLPLLPLKAPSIVKLKQVQSIIKAVQEQEKLAQALQLTADISTKITTSIKEVIAEAGAAVEIGIQYGKTALQNVIKVAEEQPEITSVGDIAALKLSPSCFNDLEKLSKEVAVRGEEFLRTVAYKIRNVDDDILDIMEKTGGHTLERHVSQTINELIGRAAGGKVEAASSFTNKRTAINAVKENLRNNAEQIAKWLKSNPSSKDQIVIEFSHSYSIGCGVPKGGKIPIYNLISSQIVLRPDSTQMLGFKIATAFPIIK